MIMREWTVTVAGMIPGLGLVLCASLVAAAPAQANVDSYLKALQQAGIHREDSDALEMGSEVCALRTLGATPERIQDQAVNNSRSYASQLTPDEAARVVAIATEELCNKRLLPKPVAPTGNQNGDSRTHVESMVL
jgi:hypothetical protein